MEEAMSAFIVSKSTMDLALMAIRKSNHNFKIGRHRDLSMTAIGRRLYQMNLEAVMQRYPYDTKDTAPGPCDISDIHNLYIFTEIDDVGKADAGWIVDPGDDPTLLALRCLRYQCSEGDVPDTWPEYQQIDHICENWG
jgi:hypothetical protein